MLIGGTEYKFVKLIRDLEYGRNRVRKLSQVRDGSLVRTNDYMRSFKEIPGDNPTCRICLS